MPSPPPPPLPNATPVMMEIYNPKDKPIQLGLRAVNVNNTLVLRLPGSHPQLQLNHAVTATSRYAKASNMYDGTWQGSIQGLVNHSSTEMYVFIVFTSFSEQLYVQGVLTSGGNQNITVVINGDNNNSVTSEGPVFTD